MFEGWQKAERRTGMHDIHAAKYPCAVSGRHRSPLGEAATDKAERNKKFDHDDQKQNQAAAGNDSGDGPCAVGYGQVRGRIP